MSEKTVAKAKLLLTDGKVLVLNASLTGANFAVQGSDTLPYAVQALTGLWTCNCKAQVECAHIQACKFIFKCADSTIKLFKTSSEFDSLFQRLPANEAWVDEPYYE